MSLEPQFQQTGTVWVYPDTMRGLADLLSRIEASPSVPFIVVWAPPKDGEPGAWILAKSEANTP